VTLAQQTHQHALDQPALTDDDLAQLEEHSLDDQRCS
jgi:hypothetical protein